MTRDISLISGQNNNNIQNFTPVRTHPILSEKMDNSIKCQIKHTWYTDSPNFIMSIFILHIIMNNDTQ